MRNFYTCCEWGGSSGLESGRQEGKEKQREAGGEKKIQVGNGIQKGFEDHWEERLNRNEINFNLICSFSEAISELLSKEVQARQKENKGVAGRIKFEEEAGLDMGSS